MLVDSHCHLNMLDLTSYPNGLDDVVKQCAELDVQHLLCVCVTLAEFPEIAAIAERYPNVKASVGLHPNEEADSEPTVEQLLELAQHPGVVAMGETGLDYFRSEGDLEWQRERFRTHIRAAKQSNLPIIVHSRDAKEDTLQILIEENAGEAGGVLHCFTGDADMAKRAVEELGFYVSFSGIVTFKNAKELQDVAEQLPLQHILVETDSPYLAPVPYRGKSNVPAYTHYVAKFIAELKGIDYEKVAKQTTENYFNLFKRAK